MTATESPELTLHDALDRLARQERKLQSIEEMLFQFLPITPTVTPAPNVPALAPSDAGTKTIDPLETPHEIKWPTKRVAAHTLSRDRKGGDGAPTPLPDGRGSPSERVRELEAQLAAAEERLKQARRLETLGRLVAGVSHDLNDLLTVISGHAEMVRELLPANDPIREPADLIATTAHTAATVARQLVAFGRPHASEPVPIDANAAVRSTERLLHRIVGGNVELDFLLAPGLPPIRTDPGQFDQVLLNLVANARDAIPDHGMVTVRTALAEAGPGRAGWPEQLPGGRFVALTVTDTGIGMTDEVKARIFDAYFTTKSENGTGLGLANVADIVRTVGGHVEVESSPAWGTTVRVYWPKAEKSGPVPVPKPRIPPSSSGETVLVVQDGETLRGLSVMAFQQAGYRVLEACDGDSAEERARLFAGTVHLLVADLGLPREDGRSLANRLRAVRPGMKVLFVSGSSPPELNGAAFLPKPYSSNELLNAARRAMGTEMT